ncbi:MAG: aldolase catalytic domain-containing protein [Ruminococcus sp.]|jgi:4-hydroxy 2-oxovalerate aldolase
MSIQILDCTLRDGGYINDWKFGRKTIQSILDKLERAGIDIVECGFLTGMIQDEECSLFDNVSAIEKLLPQRKRTSMYVAMIAIGEKELHPVMLPRHDSRSIDGIRLTFHKAEIEQAFEWAKIIMEKGYHVFMQPVGTVFYSDLELLMLVEKINQLNPYAFYIVDTLGSMYRNDVSHRFYLIDKNMNPGIRLGFHGHNNLQLAFSNAQVLGKIQTKRTLILDASVYGMGRGAGNLPTELITQYINKNIDSRYDTAVVMDIYDDYISAIRREYEWGYSMPYHIAASHVCHPNYASYLMDRRTLTMKDIEEIIRSIPEDDKVLYDRQKIERLYVQFQSRKIDDEKAVNQLRELIRNRKILLLAPGRSLSEEYDKIMQYREKESPYVITVNFVDETYGMDACFVSNHKRMDMIEQELKTLDGMLTILTSNIPAKIEKSLSVDYKRYTNGDEMISDNAGLMLLKLLKECGAGEIVLAGFDGFHHRLNGNYYSRELNLKVDEAKAAQRQERIRRQLKELNMDIRFLTKSVYEEEEHV